MFMYPSEEHTCGTKHVELLICKWTLRDFRRFRVELIWDLIIGTNHNEQRQRSFILVKYPS